MPLEPGATLGSYKATAKIGEGGMGEVWQATDTKLKRQVALKILIGSRGSPTTQLVTEATRVGGPRRNR